MTTIQEPGPEHAERPPRRRRTALVAVAAVLAVVVPVSVGVALAGGEADEPLAVSAPEPVYDVSEPSAEPSTSEAAEPTTEEPVEDVAEETEEIEVAPAPIVGDPGIGPLAEGWTLVAEDDFTGDGLDYEHWHPYEAATAGGVGQHLESNLSVADGIFTITSRGDTSGGMSYSPGQLYGRWEFRARADAATGYGPVVLLWPDAEDWPEGGEIDVMEIPEADRQWNRFTVHYGEEAESDNDAIQADFTQWNDFAVEWTPDHVAGFVNGVEYFRTTDPAAIPPRSMHLAVQQDVGPFGTDWIPARDETTPDEARLQLDWIRIYSM